MDTLFSFPIFFITFREALETAIIVSVLLAFIKRSLCPEDDPTLYTKLTRQVWLGTGVGLLLCTALGIAVLVSAHDLAETFAGYESLWEGFFSLAASAIITVMGAVLLRVSRLQEKWQVKLSRALRDDNTGVAGSGDADADGADGASSSPALSFGERMKNLSEKYALFVLPFITVLREGLEGVLFVAGVGVGLEGKAIPLPAVSGLLVGSLLGYLIYSGSKKAPIQYFLIASTCFLYLIAAGLFSRGVWHLEANEWNKIVGGDAAELGSGPGSYDIRKSVWHVNCCNPYMDGGGFWGVFNALLGWQNSATIGSVVSYNLYWVGVTIAFVLMTCKDKGYRPFTVDKGKVGGGEEDLQPLLSRPPN